MRGIKQSYFTKSKKFIVFTDVFTGGKKLKLFAGSDVVRKYTFKTMTIGDSYALSAVIFPIFTVVFKQLRVKSALFQKNYIDYINDCFECLSPHNNITA